MGEHKPKWLRKPEIDALFAAHGLSAAEQQHWLYRAVQDAGIVTRREADAAIDLFRLPQCLHGNWARRWVPSADEIQWDVFGITTPASGRHGVLNYEPTVIEASGKLLETALRNAHTTPQPRPATPKISAAALKDWARNFGAGGKEAFQKYAMARGATREPARRAWDEVHGAAKRGPKGPRQRNSAD